MYDELVMIQSFEKDDQVGFPLLDALKKRARTSDLSRDEKASLTQIKYESTKKWKVKPEKA